MRTDTLLQPGGGRASPRVPLALREQMGDVAEGHDRTAAPVVAPVASPVPAPGQVRLPWVLRIVLSTAQRPENGRITNHLTGHSATKQDRAHV